MRLALVLLVIGIAGVAAIAFLASQSGPSGSGNDGAPVQTTGKALIGGPFELVNDEGETVTEETYLGKPTLIYFGFTYCPDVCPTELNKISVALDQMAAADMEVSALNPLFVTVDPERDTVQQMHDFLTLFHPAIVGLTGSKAQVDQALSAYRVYAAKQPTGDDGSYTMDHSSIIFLMDSDGQYVRHFTIDSQPEDIVNAVSGLIG